MSGFEPLFMAAAPEVGTATLATEVMGPEFLSTVGGSEFGTPALFEGLGGGVGGALGNGLGGISGLFGTAAEGTLANGLAPTLAQNLSVAAPEALAQTQNAVLNAGIGANQGIGAAVTPQISPVASEMNLAGEAFNPVLGGNQGIGAAVAQQVSPVASEMNLAGEAFNPALGGNQGIGAAVTPQVEAAQSEMLKGLAETNPSLTPEQLAQRDLLRGSGYGEPTGGLDSLKQMMSKAGNWWDSKSDKEKLLYGGAGLLGANALFGKKQGVPAAEKYSGPLSKFHYNPSAYTPYTPQPPANPYRPVYTSYAGGGLADLGGYSDGGRMLKGPGDGMSDDIPATIANKQPARLANEEFVIPADVVSHLGNGSSEAGAKQLYKMMDRVRQARTGNKKQGKQINPEKYLA